MDDHPWMIFGPFSDVFGGSLDDFRMIYGHFWRFPDMPGRFGMFLDDSGASHIVSGAFRSCESSKKSDFSKKHRRPKFCFGRQIISWEPFEMDCGGVLGGLELISGGKRSFEVRRTAVFERSESSEASRAKRVERSKSNLRQRALLGGKIKTETTSC